MSFSERQKTIALAIVKIFETSKPFGDYSAVAVLDDGAGISYGVSQFTHKSGSLASVLRRFVALGGVLPEIVDDHFTSFTSKSNILRLAGNKQLKESLKRLGKHPLMQQAQREIAFENYLKKAIDACDGSNFVTTMSLAVIYDSINHGSYEKIRDRVKIVQPGNGSMKDIEFEKLWVTQYVQKRDAWLESVPRLAKTDYRTDFFLAQIARGNWDLKLPMTVHGFRLTEEILFPKGLQADDEPATVPATFDSQEPTVSAMGDEPQPGSSATNGSSPAALVPPVHVIEVEQVRAEEQSKSEDLVTRVQNRFLAIPAAALSALSAIGAWATDAPLNLVVTLIVAGAAITLIYIAINAIRNNGKEKREQELTRERERRAHEIQMLTLKSAMDPSLQTVRVVPQPMLNSEGEPKR